MNIKTDTATAEISTGRNPEVVAITDFTTKLPSLDKTTGLPLYKVSVELVEDGEVTAIALKIASKDAFTLAPRTDYKMVGSFYTVPYLSDGSNKISYSYKLIGSLVPVNAQKRSE
jgi:hypothetical protein